MAQLLDTIIELLWCWGGVCNFGEVTEYWTSSSVQSASNAERYNGTTRANHIKMALARLAKASEPSASTITLLMIFKTFVL